MGVAVTLNTGDGDQDKVNVESTFSGPLTVNLGAGRDLVSISPTNQDLSGIVGAVTVHGAASAAAILTVYDRNYAFATQWTMTANSISGGGATALINYDGMESVVVQGATAGNAFEVQDTAASSDTTIDTGDGPNTVSVDRTTGPLEVDFGTGSATAQLAPSSGNLDNIQGLVTIHGSGTASLTVNDQSNPNNVLTQDTLGMNSLTRVGQTLDSSGFLSSHVASVDYSGLSQLTFNTGGVACFVNVVSTAASTPITIHGSTSNVVDVGATTDGVGDIQGTVNIANNPAAGAYTTLIVDDSAYNRGYWWATLINSSLTTTQRTDTGNMVAVAPINYVQADLSALSILLGNTPIGSRGNAVFVSNTPTSGYAGGLMTTITTGIAGDGGSPEMVYVGATTGPLTVNLNSSTTNVGAGVLLGGGVRTLDNIDGPVTVNSLSGWGALALDDSASTKDHNYKITTTTVAFRPNLPVVTYHVSNDVWLTAGSGVNMVNVSSTSTATVVVAGSSGKDTISVGDAAQSLKGISSAYVSIQLAKPGNRVILNDQGTRDAVSYTATAVGTSESVIYRSDPTAQQWAQFYVSGPLAALTVNASGANDTFYVQGLPASPTHLALNGFKGANNILQGPDIANTWDVTGTNSGKLDQLISFVNVQNLVGGSAANAFKISNGKGVSGSIDGGSGVSNVLDYSAWTTGVTVNLGTGQATGIAGGVSGFNILNGSKYADNLTGGSGIDIIRGDGGNDRITGGSGNDVLIGGSTGASMITSGSGRSILIAGQGVADTLNAGAGGDIIIGGYTSYDSYTADHDKALLDILAEWISTDSYTTRIAKIRFGTGTGKFNSTTVHDVMTGDVLKGQGNYPNDPDWYWTATTSEIQDPDGGNEQVN